MGMILNVRPMYTTNKYNFKQNNRKIYRSAYSLPNMYDTNVPVTDMALPHFSALSTLLYKRHSLHIAIIFFR